MDSKIKRHTLSEVVDYLEGKYFMDTITYEQEILYQDIKWFGKIDYNVHGNTVKKIIRELDNGGYIF